ncbi:MAG: serine acetyltransferase [Chloroflexaceae bacterium]|nr:serine acetyltransferase [Chloroflexaceae bacterium]
MSRIKFWARQMQKLLATPLLLLFLLTTEKRLIMADVRRWARLELGEHRVPSEVGNLLTLLARYREFRSLFYYRLFKGNTSAILLLYLLKGFYREAPLLFIRKSCTIGPGLFLQHGFSTVINADIGANCWINQQVTIGFLDDTGRRPTLGNEVRIGAGAKVLGGITLGDHVVIGANAVVLKDVPPNCVVVGGPSFIVRRNGVRVREEL